MLRLEVVGQGCGVEVAWLPSAAAVSGGISCDQTRHNDGVARDLVAIWSWQHTLTSSTNRPKVDLFIVLIRLLTSLARNMRTHKNIIPTYSIQLST